MQCFKSLLVRFPRNRCRVLDRNPHGYIPQLFQSYNVAPSHGFSRSYTTPNRETLDERPVETADLTEDLSPPISSRPSSIKKLNQALARRKAPELVEEDLEEQFVRGMIIETGAAGSQKMLKKPFTFRKWSRWTR